MFKLSRRTAVVAGLRTPFAKQGTDYSKLTALGLGQSSAIGISGDPIVGTTHVDALRLFGANS